MEKLTTFRQSFAPKIAHKLEPIMPCGNIRMSKGTFEGATTTLLSYMNPGPVEPVPNYRPIMKYCRPKEPTAKETTQKLSYLPYQVCRKENYPWAMKPVYRPPDVSMPVDTTYKKSYLENKAPRDLPILPRHEGVFPEGAEFLKSTIYKESYLPCQTDPVEPIIPCGNIILSEKKMLCDTTNKLSYLPLKGEKRKPILPRSRKIICETNCGKIITTNQLSFTPKIAKRPEAILPCNNIRTADQPIEDKTTTALSYMKPDYVEQIPNYKPKMAYCKPEAKVDGVTVNKLSYQQWELGTKMDMPWARKARYCPPETKMATNTVCHMSFPAPGYYVDDCIDEPVEEESCPCANKDSGDH